MLPLFPHEDTTRAQQIIDIIKPMADAYWDKNDPDIFQTNPFSVLLVALFSPRTKTESSRSAMMELLDEAPTPAEFTQLSYDRVRHILEKYDVQFAENKAQYALDAAAKLAREYDGNVPVDFDALQQFDGLGWKTSLLILHLAFGEAPEICVDIHVKRISQRIGLVNPATNDPQKVSRELMDIVPRDHWKDWNPMFVFFGKTRCYPVRPQCDGCPIYDLCERVGVT